MARAWSLFLSCDARDMCRPGLAMSRVVLTWLAGAVRVGTLLLLLVDIPTVAWFTATVYWGQQLNGPAYVEFDAIRSYTRGVREAWENGAVSDAAAREEAVRLAADFRRWRERHPGGHDLFMTDFEYGEDPPGCPPFRLRSGLVQLLEGQEHEESHDVFNCDYLILLH